MLLTNKLSQLFSVKFYVGKETFYMEHRLDRGPIVLLEAENQAPEFITAFSPVGFFLASNQGIFYDFRKDSRN